MRCPVCEGSTAALFDASYVSGGKCLDPRCGHLFAVNPSPGQGVHKLGPSEAPVEGYEPRDRDLFGFLTCRGVLFEGVRLLDVGAGSGHIARVFRELLPSATIACVEADPVAGARLRESGFSLFSDLSDVTGQYDAALLVEVIEHVEHPVTFLSRIRFLLAGGGSLFLTTPCGERRNGTRIQHAFDNPEHIHFFTERSLSLSIASAGFKSFQCETINAMMSRLTPQPLRFLKDIARPLRDRFLGPVQLTGIAR